MTTELVRYQNAMTKYQPTTLDEIIKLAELFATSGLFNVDNVRQSAAQLAVKILAGQELGFTPFAAANGMFIIKGKCAPGANLMAAKVKSTNGRYDYKVIEMSDTKVSVEFFENGKSIGVSTFTAQDAARAGTMNMGKYPKNMLFARAMSNGAKWFCPDAFNGVAVYTPDELGATVDDETGEIIEVTGNVQTLSFSGPEEAISWAVEQGAFKDTAEAESRYNEIKTGRKPKSAAEMWQLWVEDVQERVEAAENAN